MCLGGIMTGLPIAELLVLTKLGLPKYRRSNQIIKRIWYIRATNLPKWTTVFQKILIKNIFHNSVSCLGFGNV